MQKHNVSATSTDMLCQALYIKYTQESPANIVRCGFPHIPHVNKPGTKKGATERFEKVLLSVRAPDMTDSRRKVGLQVRTRDLILQKERGGVLGDRAPRVYERSMLVAPGGRVGGLRLPSHLAGRRGIVLGQVAHAGVLSSLLPGLHLSV